jgi:putative salt-induced outer membrane protein
MTPHPIRALLISVTFIPGIACAQWSGKSAAGVVIASGNTSTRTANAKLDLQYQTDQWKLQLGAAGIYSSDSIGTTTAQRWGTHGQSDVNFTPKNFWFSSARYENDRFSGFLYQATLGTGVGRRFYDTSDTKLRAQAGVGYKLSQTRPSFDPDGAFIAPHTERAVIFQAGFDYEHQLTANTQVIDKFLAEAGRENTYLQNELTLQVKMNEVLALAVGYAVRHNTQPPAAFKKTDTLTTLNLVYELK